MKIQTVHLHGPHGDRDIELTWWDTFTLWVEQDATQLGIGLVTYYMFCALMGAFNAMLYAYQINLILKSIR